MMVMVPFGLTLFLDPNKETIFFCGVIAVLNTELVHSYFGM